MIPIKKREFVRVMLIPTDFIMWQTATIEKMIQDVKQAREQLQKLRENYGLEKKN